MHDNLRLQNADGHLGLSSHPAHVAVLCVSRGRKGVGLLFSKITNRRFAFAFVAAAVITAKIIHIAVHQRAFSRRNLLFWTLSFLAQDFVLLISLRILVDWTHHLPRKHVVLRNVAKVCQAIAIVFAATVSIVNITFYACSRSEMRWRNVDFAKDKSSRGVLLSGLATLMGVLFGLTTLAWICDNFIFSYFGLAIDVVKWPFMCLRRTTDESDEYKRKYEYMQLSPGQSQSPPPCNAATRKQDFLASLGLDAKPRCLGLYTFCRAVWSVTLLIEIISCAFRPAEGSLVYMSWTVPLIPFVDFKDSASTLQQLQPVLGVGINYSWDNITALGKPVPLTWLPSDKVLPGFEDWYGSDKQHYNAAADPLNVSNLDQKLLSQLQDSLSDVSIKHILLIVMESTRKDVFPIKKNELVWNRFADVSPNNNLTDIAVERFRTLTQVANHLTGDYDDGFAHDDGQKPRGGLNFKDAYTSATYTRKSMLGTLCGAWPLVADFNMEYLHHIYQPCLPQILEAFNYLDQQNATEGSAVNKWNLHYLQSVSLNYDHADVSTEQFGFPPENIIGAKYLRSPSAKFGQVDLPDINYFGMAEAPLADYVRDIFSSAKKSNERVFMTHLTSTTHHPYAMPAEEMYVPLGNGRLNHLSHYINTIGYDDRWLGKILGVLDQEGVADETLVIVTGDHGISLPENDKPASYYNPNVGCNHVPLVISHPKLPPIDITESVSTLDLLPTILDVLRETGSLSNVASQAASDLIANYEGHSLIRNFPGPPPSKSSLPGADSGESVDSDNQHSLGNWQFIVMNPGRAMVGIRDRLRPHWRLVVPVIHNVEWKFTDLESDPTDNNPVQGFGFADFIGRVEQRHGRTEALWAEEAAFIARWWVEENNKRWQYGIYEASKPE